MRFRNYALTTAFLSVATVALLAQRGKPTFSGDLEVISSGITTKTHTPKQAPLMKADLVSPYIFIEDFESVPGVDPYPLPEGWTQVTIDGGESARWLGATLGNTQTGEPFPGTSGTKYAVVLPNENNIETWMYSPVLHMEKGKNYDIYFSVYKPQPNAGNSVSNLRVTLGKTTDPADEVEYELVDRDNSDETWSIVRRTFSPAETADYYLGFCSTCLARGYITAIDDVLVTEACGRVFNYPAVYFPTKKTLDSDCPAELFIQNIGSGLLTLNLIDHSPEIKVDKFPTQLGEGQRAYVELNYTGTTPGEWEGYVTFATNDPLRPEVTVNCFGIVEESVVTGYTYEDFSVGTPAGWDLADFFFQNKKGVDDSRCLEGWTLTNLNLHTHYIEMGDNPVLNLDYKAQKYDASGMQKDLPPTKPEYVKFSILISDDFGESFTQVYRVDPEDGDMAHVLSYDFATISIPLPQYAGKTCQMKLEVDPAEQWMVDDYALLLDNFEMGTCLQHDLYAVSLYGDGLLKVGEENNFILNIRNGGREDVVASDYNVSIIDENGNVLVSKSGEDISHGSEVAISIAYTPSSAASAKIHALIDYADDDPTNNSTDIRNIRVEENDVVLVSTPDPDPVKPVWTMHGPTNYYYMKSATQVIYHANDLNATSVMLDGIRYQINSDTKFTAPECEVWIGETDRNNFNDGKMLSPADFVKVYSGAISVPEGESNFDIPFDTPYAWGGRNLVVYVVKKADTFYLNKMFLGSRDANVMGRSISMLVDNGKFDENHPEDGNPENVRLNDAVPVAEFHWVKNENVGSISGHVTCEGKPVEDARVLIEGTSCFAITDAVGFYEFKNVTAGEVTLNVSGYPYIDNSGEIFTVSKGETTIADIEIAIVPSREVKINVVDASGQAIKGGQVRLLGYGKYKAEIDDSGVALFPGVLESEGYALEVERLGYKPYYTTIDVSTQVEKSVVLHEVLSSPLDLEATTEGSNVTLSWEAPLDLFAYDNGEIETTLGFTLGNKNSLIGIAFPNVCEVREIQWFTNNSEDTAVEYVNVYIMSLDETGTPTANILAGIEGAPNKEGEWNTYRFEDPINAPNGFYLGISCNGGFVGIAAAKPMDEVEQRKGRVWTTNDYTFQAPAGSGLVDGNWTDNYGSSNHNIVPMIRALGVDKGYIDFTDYSPIKYNWYASPAKTDSSVVAHPEVKYSIALNGIEKVSGIEDTNYTFTDLEDGFYVAEVKAVYAGGESESIIQEFSLEGTGVESVIIANCAIGPNPFDSYLSISDISNVRSLTIASITAYNTMEITVKDNIIDTSSLPSGIYVATLILTDGSRKSFRMIKK